MSAAITALVAGLRARTWHGGATLRLGNESCEAILEVLRRDWAVRVLDAWTRKDTRLCWVCMYDQAQAEHPLACAVELMRGRDVHRVLSGSTPDAARLAAAEAVWPELPESVRAELGVQP